MPARYEKVEEYHQEIEENRDRLTPPRDKAVFYTNAGAVLLKEVREHTSKHNAMTIEGVRRGRGVALKDIGRNGTPYGVELEKDALYEYDRATELSPMSRREFADAVWDQASRTYAQQASGRVEVFIGSRQGQEPKVNPTSTFARIERDELIRNEKVTSINGVDREVLLEILNDNRKTKADKAQEVNDKLIVGQKQREKRTNKEVKETPLTNRRRQKNARKLGVEEMKRVGRKK